MGLAGERVAALIPAAGSGSRMGGPVAKPFLRLGAREILAYTLDIFETCDVIDEIWVMVAAKHRDLCRHTVIEQYGFHKVRGVIAGGATRQESVWQGLQQVGDDVALVVVHDGVRPFATCDLVQAAVQQAALHGAAIAAIPVKDTLKRVSAAGEVEATVPRQGLWRIQTPQAFRRQLLLAAFRHAWAQGIAATDESGLVENLGQQVRIVPGVESNVKITTPDDLRIGMSLLHQRD